MKTLTFIGKLALVLGALTMFSACTDNSAEESGEKLDELVADAKDAAEDGKEKAEEMATDAGNAIEDACEDVKEKADAEDQDC